MYCLDQAARTAWLVAILAGDEGQLRILAQGAEVPVAGLQQLVQGLVGGFLVALQALQAHDLLQGLHVVGVGGEGQGLGLFQGGVPVLVLACLGVQGTGLFHIHLGRFLGRCRDGEKCEPQQGDERNSSRALTGGEG